MDIRIKPPSCEDGTDLRRNLWTKPETKPGVLVSIYCGIDDHATYRFGVCIDCSYTVQFFTTYVANCEIADLEPTLEFAHTFSDLLPTTPVYRTFFSTITAMGLTISSLFQNLFGNKEMRAYSCTG
jgi:hypothetical protein